MRSFRSSAGLRGESASVKLPRLAILPLAYMRINGSRTHSRHPATYSARGVKMAKYKMHYDCSKAVRELGLPQTPVEVACWKRRCGGFASTAMHNRMLKTAFAACSARQDPSRTLLRAPLRS